MTAATMGETAAESRNSGIVPSMVTQPQAAPAVPEEMPLAHKEWEGSPADFRMIADRIKGDLLHFGSAVPEPWDYRPMPPFVLDPDGYLIEDWGPKTHRYVRRMLAYGTVLQSHYLGRGMVAVDLSMPYVEGCPGKMVSPDLFVALAAEDREDRDWYKLWEEPTPDFVLDDLSPANGRSGAVDKRVLYRRLGVREYWLFDETGTRLPDDAVLPPGGLLVGYRLHDDGYAPIRANAAGRLPSAALGLELVMRDGLLRFFDPAAGEYLLIYDESEQRIKAAERLTAALERETEAIRGETEALNRETEALRQTTEAINRETEAINREREATRREGQGTKPRTAVLRREREAAEKRTATRRREREAAERRTAVLRREREAAEARVAELKAELRA